MSDKFRKCEKCGIKRNQDMSVTYHRFPVPGLRSIAKAHAWAKFCWPDVDFDTEQLQCLHRSNKQLCGRHFKSCDFYDSERKKLCIFAIPSVSGEHEPMVVMTNQENKFDEESRTDSPQQQATISDTAASASIQKDIPKVPLPTAEPRTLVAHKVSPLTRTYLSPTHVFPPISDNKNTETLMNTLDVPYSTKDTDLEMADGIHNVNGECSAVTRSTDKIMQDETNQGDDDSEQINNETAISDIDTAPNAADESDNEIEEEMEVWAGSARVLVCAECGRAADCGGKLYQCVECPRVVCAACEREERHRQHCLLRLPSRAVYDKLRVLYESLRETVTAHLCDDDELLVPKEEPLLEPEPLLDPEPLLEPDPLNATSNAIGNSKRLIVNAPSLVKSGPELILIPGARSVPATISVPAAKSVHAPKSVPAPISVPAAKSVRAPKSVPKFIFQARVSKPKSVPDSKSDERPLMSNLPGDHGHSYTVISTGAAKWTGTTRPTSSTERCEPTTTAKRKKPERQKDDEEPVYMDVEYLMTDEEE